MGRLFTNFEHYAKATGAGKLAATRFELEGKVGTDIKTLEVRIHGGIDDVEPPENHKE